jgi:hypothetical protein
LLQDDNHQVTSIVPVERFIRQRSNVIQPCFSGDDVLYWRNDTF